MCALRRGETHDFYRSHCNADQFNRHQNRTFPSRRRIGILRIHLGVSRATVILTTRLSWAGSHHMRFMCSMNAICSTDTILFFFWSETVVKNILEHLSLISSIDWNAQKNAHNNNATSRTKPMETLKNLYSFLRSQFNLIYFALCIAPWRMHSVTCDRCYKQKNTPKHEWPLSALIQWLFWDLSCFCKRTGLRQLANR